MLTINRKLIVSGLLFFGIIEGISLHAQVDTNVPIAEVRLRKRLVKTALAVSGHIRDNNGQPVSGAVVSLNGLTVTNGSDGAFTFARCPRTNGLVRISAPGFRDELIAEQLLLPGKTKSLALDDIY